MEIAKILTSLSTWHPLYVIIFGITAAVGYYIYLITVRLHKEGTDKIGQVGTDVKTSSEESTNKIVKSLDDMKNEMKENNKIVKDAFNLLIASQRHQGTRIQVVEDEVEKIVSELN